MCARTGHHQTGKIMSKGSDELITLVLGLSCPGSTQLFLPKDPGREFGTRESVHSFAVQNKTGDSFN